MYTAKLPLGYKGQFGPMIKSWIIVLYFAMNVTEPKIITFLKSVGIFISSGKVSDIIHTETGRMHGLIQCLILRDIKLITP